MKDHSRHGSVGDSGVGRARRPVTTRRLFSAARRHSAIDCLVYLLVSNVHVGVNRFCESR